MKKGRVIYMRGDKLSQAIGDIDVRFIHEALVYKRAVDKEYFHKSVIGKYIIAAAVLICVLIGFSNLNGSNVTAITVYAYGTNEQITGIESVLSTGRVNTDGSMTGAPLQFYLKGERIKTVRYSVKNQWISFMDWTNVRDNYGTSKNFTIPYGTDKEEYYYLVVNWEPNELWQAVNEQNHIRDLPQELREDLIVFEITYENESTQTKAIRIKLQENGAFTASFEDYTITNNDTFIFVPDNKPIGSEILDSQIITEDEWVQEDPTINEAKEQAIAYYEETVFDVIAIGFEKYDATDIVFSVCVSMDGKIQNPNHRIVLRYKDESWFVIAEGY